MGLTVVSTFFPLPEDRGDPVRVLMMLRALARTGPYTLLVVRRPDTTPEQVDELRSRLPGVEVRAYQPTPYRLGRLGPPGRYAEALRAGMPPWVRTRYSRALHQDLAARTGPAVAIGEAAAAYFPGTGLRWHWDKANVLAASTRQDVEEAPGLVHRLRARYLARISHRFEARALSSCGTVSVTSAEESARLRAAYGRRADLTLPSCVPVPVGHVPRPRDRSLVWLGSFAYRPNVVGLLRFLDEGWAPLRRAGYTMRLVGSGPVERVRKRLESYGGLTVLGYVADLRPELARAQVAVVPLWTGAGTKLKTVTLLAHSVPVFSTAVGAEGVPATDAVRVADTPGGLADAILAASAADLEHMARTALRLVEREAHRGPLRRAPGRLAGPCRIPILMSTRRLASASLANLLIPATGLLVSPFLSRALGPDGRGLYAALTLPIVVYGWAGTYGLQDALSFHLRAGRLSARDAAKVSLFAAVPLGMIGVGLLIVSGLGIFAGNTRHYLEFVALSALVPLHVLANLLIGALTGAGDVRGVNLVKVVPALLRTVLVVAACVLFHVDAFGAGLLFLASTAAGLAVGLTRFRTGPAPDGAPPGSAPTDGAPPAANRRVPVRPLVTYSVKCLPGVLAAISSARLDQIIGLPVIGARQLGYYAVAVSVAELPMVIATAARTVLMGRPATGDQRQATRAARLAVLASAGACGLLALAAPVAVPWFFGATFAPAVAPTLILCAATPLYTCMVLLSAALLVSDRAGWSSAALVSGSLAGVVLLFLLAPIGAVGAALASLGGYGLSVAVAGLAIRRAPHAYPLRTLTIPYREDVRAVSDKLRTIHQRPPVLAVTAWVRRTGWETVGVGALLVLAWLRIAVPATIQVLGTGRPVFNARDAAMPAAGTAAGNALSLAFLAVALVLVARGLWRRQASGPGWLAVVIAPLAAIAVSGFVNHEPPQVIWLALPLAAAAIWLQPPRFAVLGTIGVLGAVTAAGSVLLALVRPDLGLLSGTAAGAKGGFVGGLLAGPYPHSNVLGIALALSLPFALCIDGKVLRRAALVAILVALAWTQARTSQAAAAIVLVTYLLIRRYPARTWLPALPALAGLALIVLVPLSTRDPLAFSRRGRIWQVLLHRWAEHPVLGLGPDYFQRQRDLAKALGGQFTHGHNLMVQLLVVGGLLALVLFAALLSLTWRQAAALARAGQPAPVLFLVALGQVSWLEASHVTTTLAGHLTWLPLFLIARLGPSLPGRGRPERYPPGSPAVLDETARAEGGETPTDAPAGSGDSAAAVRR